MGYEGRNIGADISKIGMRWDLQKNGKVVRKWRYYDRHSDFYDSLYKFLDGHIGKNFDESFSKFCQRFLKVMESYNTRAEFLKRFKKPNTEKVHSYEYYVDDNGNIQAGEQYHRPRKQVKVYYDKGPSKIVIKPNLLLINKCEQIKRYIYYSLGKTAYDEIMSGREIDLKQFEGFINSTRSYDFNYKISKLATNYLHLRPGFTGCKDETVFSQVFPQYEYRKFDILYEGTPEYRQYIAEEKDKRRKLARKAKKQKEETLSNLLWSIEDKRKAAEIAKDIIDRDRLGFDDGSFKGEFYHGQKRKKK